MKKFICAFLSLSIVTATTFAQDKTPVPPGGVGEAKVDLSKVFKSDKEKFSYFIGMFAAKQQKAQLKRFEIDIDNSLAANGFKDFLNGSNELIPESQLNDVLQELNKVIKAKIDEKASKSKAEGIAFLEKNKSLPGVTALTNGLQYSVIKEGTGPVPGPTDEVKVHYTGTLIDGTVFDSSKKRGIPFVTRVNGGIIEGWKQILKMMKVGSTYKVVIPPELAYGANPPGAQIPPNAVLIFEMELISTGQPAEAPANLNSPLTSDIIKVPSQEEMKKGAKIETIKAEDANKAKTNK